jgi:hypothetical protein
MAIWRLLRRRVVVAVLGALLFGGVSGLFAGAQLVPPTISVGQGTSANVSGSPGVTTTATGGGTPTMTSVPKATAAPPAPTIPRPTPTIPVPGTSAHLFGSISSTPNGNTFTLRSGGLTFTIVVNSDATVTVTLNGVKSTVPPSALQQGLQQGMRAQVQGIWSTSSTLAASSVSAYLDN